MALTSSTRKCRKCGKIKSLSRFEKFRNKNKVGIRYVCRKCRKWVAPKGYWRKFSKNDSHKRACKKYRESKHGKRKNRNSYLQRNHNITLKEYDKMLEQQNGVCYICGLPEIGRRLAVDHNHKTGDVRKLLCHQCNCCIGFIESKNLSIEKIQKYLEN